MISIYQQCIFFSSLDKKIARYFLAKNKRVIIFQIQCYYTLIILWFFFFYDDIIMDLRLKYVFFFSFFFMENISIVFNMYLYTTKLSKTKNSSKKINAIFVAVLCLQRPKRILLFSLLIYSFLSEFRNT